MHETQEDLVVLQQLIEASITNAGDFLRSSFEMPEKSLSANQLIRFFNGVKTVALATSNREGQPRVAPIGAMLYRGSFTIPTVEEAARVKMLRRQPSISLTYYETTDFAIIVHGHVAIIAQDHPDFATLVQLQKRFTGSSVLNWGTGVFIKVIAETLYTYARYIENYPA
jgi:hypothetical protein